ncbi:MAG: hypothetical protein Q7R41_20145 [Phycisphaerales bacterium]|nr:hypothetical protein [Phycisphaerales bacterium]
MCADDRRAGLAKIESLAGANRAGLATAALVGPWVNSCLFNGRAKVG